MEPDLEKKNAYEWVELEKLLASVVKEQKPNRLKFLNDIFRSVLKLAKESPGTLNLKITATTLKELRYSFKMFSPYRSRPKITIFGSARVPDAAPLYKLAKEFAHEAAKRNFMVITGGGPGIMAAGNEGAASEGGFGLNIRLPVEQDPNAFIDTSKMLIHYKYFFTRKLFLVKEACAFAFFPGGFGTFDEAFEVLTLLQTGKSSLIPVVFLEPKGFGFWKGFMEFLDNYVIPGGFISAGDKALFCFFDSPKQALDHIELFYKNYHSMRFVEDKLVIRMKKKLSPKIMNRLTEQFQDLSLDKQFLITHPLAEELNEPELKDLARLVFRFDKQNYGYLRRLVDFINENS